MFSFKTSTGIGGTGFNSQYEVQGPVDELLKKAGELGVAYTVTIFKDDEKDEPKVWRTHTREAGSK